MSNSLKNNGYHVLGLDTSASQKDIVKRANSLTKFIQIDDVPQYDLDLGIFDNFRTEDSVKEAVQKLTSPKKQIRDYFFWFNIADSVDEQALGILRKKDLEGAIKVWEYHSQDDSTKTLFYKKNLAVLYCILLFKENNVHYLNSSLKIWNAIVNSAKFWDAFSKIYKLNDELNVDQEVIDEFRRQVNGYISDIYTELSGIHKNKEFIAAFSRIFGLQGQKVEKEVLNPIYKTINETIEKLGQIKISEGGSMDVVVKEKIKELISTAQLEFNKIIDLELYDSTQVQIIRDHFAESMRSVVIDIHNKLNDYALAKRLIEVAIEFCGTPGEKGKLTDERGLIQKHLDNENNSIFTFKVKGFFTKPQATFTSQYVEYKGEKIFYKDAIGVAWTSTRKSTNGIPTSESYEFRIKSQEKLIDISFSVSIRGSEEDEKNYGRMVGISRGIIQPIIVKKLVADIFDKGLAVNIGTIHIDNKGYWRDKFFSRSEHILWPDVKYRAKLHTGSAYVFVDNKGTAKTFASVPMSSINAVLIPELLDACLLVHSQHVKR